MDPFSTRARSSGERVSASLLGGLDHPLQSGFGPASSVTVNDVPRAGSIQSPGGLAVLLFRFLYIARGNGFTHSTQLATNHGLNAAIPHSADFVLA
jgi:hypothetical protein